MAEAAARSLRGPRCLLWALLCAGSWSLISAQTPQVIQVPENHSVNLPCKAIAGQGTPSRLEWKFEGSGNREFVYYHDQLTDNYKNRAEFHLNEIYLKSATRQDSGKYTCQVVGDSGLSESVVDLIVQVPPSKPKAEVPSSVTIGNRAVLSCVETDGSPPPTFKWYRNDILIPTDPKTNTLFQNSSYTLDSKTGVLTFEPATAFDAGDYACEADNQVGTSQKSEAVRMEPSEVNVGGIVAAVVVLLIVFGLAAFGIWFAYSRGFFKRRDTTNKKVIYSQPSTRSDGEFKQTSSFLV
ncbi:junctional adhesion molecule A isoform X3 [Eublepharis macularius]|uniref:Junctional adhesion molecule A n=1 Tax=Eublepharis macularius TaxID=481883 RepID=A0AA97LER2_EUBMA|nr:junctional adhesion molecule A isoform X3 [Eublepharis macularius]